MSAASGHYLKQEEGAPKQSLASDDGLEDPRIVALEAQFFLAPSLALVEMREMLLDAGLPKSIAGEVEELSLARLLLEECSAEFGAGPRAASLQRQDPRA